MTLVLVTLGFKTKESIELKAQDKTGIQFYDIAALALLAMTFQSTSCRENSFAHLPNGITVDVNHEKDAEKFDGATNKTKPNM